MTLRALTKYNVDLIDVVDDEDKFMNAVKHATKPK
jgi:hypothetical protein